MTLLTATNDLADEDGLGAISYQWKSRWSGHRQCNRVHHTPSPRADVGHRLISVTASYTDNQGTAESVTSTETGQVANINDDPTGTVTISGVATEDEVLTATNDLADEDGMGPVSYQWKRDGAAITGETTDTYTLTQLDVGQAFSVTASYTDDQGTAEQVTSATSAVVANANDLPTGTVTITGIAIEDEILTATNDLADEDGLGAVSYQWKRDGSDITGETTDTYTLTQLDVGQAISVTANYTDGQGTAENITSNDTGPVANINDDPTGTVTISGTAEEDQTLTASHNLADEDGLGPVSYQWSRNELAIDGATHSTFALTQADVGTQLTVTASYTDNHGTAESVTSVATSAVANVNDTPVGVVTITGIAIEDEVLAATNDLADEDGLSAISYQWTRDGVAIDSATESTYTLTQLDVGQAISVTVSYTDDQGTAEQVTSATSAVVANVNDLPTGRVTITGIAIEDEILTATNDLTDEDGLGPISYQWTRNGVAIDGATGSTLALTQADVGQTLNVTASYTDSQGTAESVTSTDTGPVTNINDDPTGTVTISGTAEEDQILTASHNLADEDGMDAVDYQWKRNGSDITGETTDTYTLTQADVGQAISVTVNYTDNQGTVESVTSTDTVQVENINDDPTGTVTISGTPTEDQVLTAGHTLADEDGLGTISWQWNRDAAAIDGATESTYTLTQLDVGQAISVTASYTDDHGTAESVTSTETGQVAHINDDPTGTVTISGVATEDEVLTATNDLADEDGMGPVSYQWNRNGITIDGATGSTLVLTQADVGTQLTVTASYIDNQGTAESVTSSDTGPVTNINDDPTGTVTISGTATEDQILTASHNLADEDGLGTISWQWNRDAAAIDSATESTYTLTQLDVGQAISVTASYTDDQGTAEKVDSPETDQVTNVNDLPTGTVTISGIATEDEILTATNDLTDEDGLGPVSYQWKRDGAAIDGATNSTLALTQADVGTQLTVTASYIDNQGTAESVTSVATAAVTNINDTPVGVVTITGIATEDETLAATNDLTDEDGLGAVSYQWSRDGVAIDSATESTYTLTQADVGQTLSVTASYTDDQGNAEGVTSAATAAVANVNDTPVGVVTITGIATEDDTLTATNDLADEDGLGTLSYQWSRDGVAIDSATESTYTLTQADVGQTLTVTASYTDDQGTAESVTSAATAAVANVNDTPVGVVTITGIATEDEVLAATNDLADEDGLGTLSYQWNRDGVAIDGATESTYTLTQLDVAQAISVTANYTDDQGTAESVTSVATAAVANVNDTPVGVVTITGIATEDEILTATNDLGDEDGLGTISYQWNRDGVAIDGATNSPLSLTQADVGHTLTVTASYTDDQGTAESVTSAATAAVANVNDTPVGVVTITGIAIEDEILTATNDLADKDGLGAVSYQWKRDGSPITGETTDTYTLTQLDVGQAISVTASYIDDHGTAESVTSTETGKVENIYDPPTGTVTITGVATEDQLLTASHTLADEDGMGPVSYQWKRDGSDITGETTDTYTLVQADVEQVITVTASYTDDQGTPKSVTSSATAAVTNINDTPAGVVTITGIATEDEILTATNDLADEDGLSSISYQWKRDGAAIDGATHPTYTLTQLDVGQAISVTANYTDDHGTAESMTSTETGQVANINDLPTGTVTISGVATEDQALTANHTLADEDGMGPVSYQWSRDGVAIDSETESTYTLTQLDVGQAISVTASYTDDQGTAEKVDSPETGQVANVNDLPTGTVTISGIATEDEILTATNDLTDEDGLATIAYQWKRDGAAIDGETNSTLALTQADVGTTLTVTASYIDDQGTAESVTSSDTDQVTNINDDPTGTVTISGTAEEDQTLTASHNLTDEDGMGPVSYQWNRDGVAIDGATDSIYTLTQPDVGQTLTVAASYIDDHGTAESVTSASTAAVANVNDTPVGVVTITGIAIEDEVLNATNDLADEDGMGPVSYQWKRDGADITGETTDTYTLTQLDVGQAISVTASYIDDHGTAESVTSTETGKVENIYDSPTGTVTISGVATEDQLLTASHTLADEDGMGPVSYQWKRDGSPITGETTDTYTLTQLDVGQAISVTASYTDNQGTSENVTSAATAAVANVNDTPVGVVTITGIAIEDEVIAATNDLADEDGLGTVSYQWHRDGVAIDGATESTYTLTQLDVGQAISVTASYTDDQGTAEQVISATSAVVANINDLPTGTVAISGVATEDQVLTVSNTLADEDGLGTVSYQWKRDGAAITGETTDMYTLAQADVGTTLTVTASYTDNQGTAESVTSTETAQVANVNDLPTGTVTISGTAEEDQTLTASNNLTDEDGLGAISYQWSRDGVAISGKTTDTYTLAQLDVGTTITVTANYTDDQGTAESVTSAATATVTNVNDTPAGVVTITGIATEDEILTATNDLADEDGLGAISYQWSRDGAAIDGAINSTLALTQADVGTTLTVTASYTDDHGTSENVTSMATTAVTNVNDTPVGVVTITGIATEDEVLTATNGLADEDGLGDISYQWNRDGVAIDGATNSTLALTQADVGTTITVTANYTDDQGTVENVTSAATAAVANVNDTPVGVVTITGIATEDQVLTASHTLADKDGLGAISYQWKRDGADITGETTNTYTLAQADVGTTLTVTASYTDNQGTAESVTSAATAAVANVNDTPVGVVTITGIATEDEILTATNDLTDEDGLGAVSYQWNRDGVAIDGATNSTLALTQADVGTTLTVTASYTDDHGTSENVTSMATTAVTNVNDTPVGVVTITGIATEDEILTATNGLADEDGLGDISYQWNRDGVAIDGATNSTLALTQADVGTSITVTASYTDDQGTAESVTSAATAAITNVNDTPMGVVTITGTATEDQVLTASHNLADEDGLGAVSYQWNRDGVAIDSATASTYTLTQADVGQTLTVAASYTDDQGTAESVTSASTTAVSNVNNSPVGSVTITGIATEDEILTATNDLADEDGLGTIAYQWKRDGADITGETTNTYTLAQLDVGTTITARASYTDNHGTAEGVTSAATAAVANVNDTPVGVVTITGIATEDELLTATNNLTDEDGLGAVSYQWNRDAAAIDSATESTYKLTQLDVGQAITVTASYTDNQGTAESVTSAATAAVTNVNDIPVGVVTITGIAIEDEVLTATNDLTDEDGLGAVSYQWSRDGVAIDSATESTYTLTQTDVGQTLSVTASYTDNQGNAEGVTSAATAAVTNVNDTPVGVVTITGIATEDEILTATNGLADEDGLGDISYQWNRDGVAIDGATNSTLALTQADVGTSITVTATYTDNQGNAESVTSSATATVTNVNDLPVVTSPLKDITPIEDDPNLDIDLAPVFHDNDPLDDAAMTYAVTLNTNSTLVTTSITGDTLTLDFQDDQYGTANITVTASSGLDTANDTFTVTITNVNDLPLAIAMVDTTTSLPEDADTSSATKMGNILITDIDGGINPVVLSGADATAFEVAGSELWLKAGVPLDYDIQNHYTVTLNTGAVSTSHTLMITEVDEPSIAGDYDASGTVDQADYALWYSTFGSTTELAADGNGNGVVDAADYNVYRDNLGNTAAFATAAGSALPAQNDPADPASANGAQPTTEQLQPEQEPSTVAETIIPANLTTTIAIATTNNPVAPVASAVNNTVSQTAGKQLQATAKPLGHALRLTEPVQKFRYLNWQTSPADAVAKRFVSLRPGRAELQPALKNNFGKGLLAISRAARESHRPANSPFRPATHLAHHRHDAPPAQPALSPGWWHLLGSRLWSHGR